MRVRKLTAWLRLVRVSNHPTVVSNALTGCAIGAIGQHAFPWATFAVLAPALVLLYAAGMALNDAADAQIDRRERPSRPIPAGDVSRRAAFMFAGAAMVAALGLAALTGLAALAFAGGLAACVVAYDLLHTRHAATVLLMAACRGLAVLTAAAGAGWSPGADGWGTAGTIAAIVSAYTVSISLVARNEAGNQQSGDAGDAGVSIEHARAEHAFNQRIEVRPVPRVVNVVVLMICAISLLDAVFLGFMQRWGAVGAALACFALSVTAQRRVIGS